MTLNKLSLFLISIFFVNSLYAQWSLTGNAISSSHFLGTINAQPLIFKQNNQNIFYGFGNTIMLGKQFGLMNLQDNTYVFGYDVTNDDSGPSGNSFAIGRNHTIRHQRVSLYL